jgi:hypothetical protein
VPDMMAGPELTMDKGFDPISAAGAYAFTARGLLDFVEPAPTRSGSV